MNCGSSSQKQTHQLLELWKQAFGEHNGFWELFLETAYAPQRCRCLTEQGQVLAALTWMDASVRGQKLAYIYAVATQPEYRGRGLCHRLLEDTHAQLAELGYSAAILVPGDPGLRTFYRKAGYETCTSVREFACGAFGQTLALRTVGPSEYAQLRRDMLPEGGVVQEGESLSFLAGQAQLYAGESCLLAAWQEDGVLNILELLGAEDLAPRIVKTLGCWEGHVRMPGWDKPFAMGYPLLENARLPEYFGLAFD